MTHADTSGFVNSRPRRIEASQRSRMRRQLPAWLAVASAAAGLAVLAHASQWPQLPSQLAGAMQALLPALIAAAGLVSLWRAGLAASGLLMAATLLGLVWPATDLTGASHALGAAGAASASCLLLLPLAAGVLHRASLKHLGFSGRLRRLRDLGLFAVLAGVLVPGLACLMLALGHRMGVLSVEPGTLPQLGVTWAAALLAGGAALLAAPRRVVNRTPGPALALAATTAGALAWVGLGHGDALWLPHVLLSLHATRGSARQTGWLALALVLTGSAAALPTQALLGLGLLPLLTQALSTHGRREREAWRAALDAQGIALAEWHLPQGGVRASQRWLALTGDESGAQWSQAPLDWIRHAHPRDKDATRRALRSLLGASSQVHLRMQLRLAADGGDWRWHELHAHVPQRDAEGRATGLVTTLSDITARHVAQERELMTTALFQHVREGLAVLDSHWRVVEANPAYCELMGSPREAIVGRTAAPLASSALRRHGFDLAQVQASLAGGHTWRAQFQLEREAGVAPVQLALQLSSVPEPEGQSPRWRVLGLADVSEPLRQQEQMRRLVRFDAATGLANRDEFMLRLQQALTAARRDGFKLVICVIDLDDFARINADHGQLVADTVLMQLAQRLQGALRSGSGVAGGTDVVARLFGDEFAVLLRVQSADESLHAVERLAALLAAPVPIRESQVGAALAIEVGASTGATLFPADDADPETLLRHASHALYRAKQAGRGGVQFHDPTTRPRDEAGLLALARIQRAFDDGELLLHYQPQIELRSGRITGVEALLRWEHPERGLLPAAHFLPLVETTGLALQIGEWVLEQALAQAGAWRDAGLELAVSVNVGARQLRRADFPQRLQELLQRQRSEVAAQLHLDVLEADALHHTEAAQALIQRCIGLGVGIALDDFGAGYSNLGAMKRLQVDTLKLSRQLVQGMLADAQDRSLVTSVIGLARNMGCAVLAKGVESGAHARELLRLDCRLGQGNAIAAAMPAAAVAGWIAGFAQTDWPRQVANAAPPQRPPQPPR